MGFVRISIFLFSCLAGIIELLGFSRMASSVGYGDFSEESRNISEVVGEFAASDT